MKKLVSGAPLLAGLAVLAIAATALATPIIGVQGTNLAVGAFESIEAKTLSTDWQARIDTKGATDVYVVENKIAPGGTFGWHSHPGPSIVVVKAGELTLYRGDDPTCTPTRRPGRVRIRRRRRRRPPRAQRGQRRCSRLRHLARSEGRGPADRRAEPRQLSLLGRRQRDGGRIRSPSVGRSHAELPRRGVPATVARSMRRAPPDVAPAPQPNSSPARASRSATSARRTCRTTRRASTSSKRARPRPSRRPAAGRRSAAHALFQRSRRPDPCVGAKSDHTQASCARDDDTGAAGEVASRNRLSASTAATKPSCVYRSFMEPSDSNLNRLAQQPRPNRASKDGACRRVPDGAPRGTAEGPLRPDPAGCRCGVHLLGSCS